LLQIRPIRTGDLRPILRLTGEEDWGFGIRDLRRMRLLEPRGCLVAALDTRIIGFTTAISYGKKLGWVGNVVVQRSHRRKGVGSRLVASAIDHLRRSHVMSIALNSYPESQPMYERLGFVAFDGFVTLSMSIGAFQPAKRMERTPFRGILNLDKRAFGADRTRLLRSLFNEFPNAWAWIAETSNVVGYSLVKDYERSSEIGPAISEQRGEDAIATLLRFSISLARKWPLEVSVPESNETALRIAKSLGFEVQRRGVVMRLHDLREITINPAVVALGFLDKG